MITSRGRRTAPVAGRITLQYLGDQPAVVGTESTLGRRAALLISQLLLGSGALGAP